MEGADTRPMDSVESTVLPDDTATLQGTEAVDIHAVVRTLHYFDIFHHPLTRAELTRFCPVAPHRIGAALLALQRDGLVHACDDHHALRPVEALLEQRRVNETRASSRMAKAMRMSRFIAGFPYVEAVMLSGSMSKGVLAADGDIDYFIVTRPGRLWVARTLLVLYKKLFLLNSRRDFCVNYFVDTEHLPIEDRNLYTATEVVTLKPMIGNATCTDFFRSNEWAFQRFPNHPRPVLSIGEAPRGRAKRMLERALNGRIGEHLDDLCMRLTFLRWKRRFSGMDARTFELALRTRKYVSKHHPQSFQHRVLDALNERMVRFARGQGHSLS